MENFIDHFNFNEYSKDIKINIKNILKNESKILSEEELYGIIISILHTKNNKEGLEVFLNTFDIKEEYVNAAKGASVLMAMNNVYYRGKHWLKPESEYQSFKQNLRMMFYSKHGIEATTFEIYALAVSFVNGCEYCVNGHAEGLRKHGITNDKIHETLRVASVINALHVI